MEKGFKKWYNKYVGQKETAEAVSRPLDEVSPVEAFCFLRLRSVQIPMRLIPALPADWPFRLFRGASPSAVRKTPSRHLGGCLGSQQ